MKRISYIFLTLFFAIFLTMPQASFAQTNSFQQEIIYDIIVDRFNNGKHRTSEQIDIHDPYTYNGGDIKGITMMLDTIHEYGFTAISLSPVFENAPKGYHGYWIEDFYAIESEFGDVDELKELIKTAHDKEMKVILELVVNYVSKSSPLVNDPEKKDWFKEVDITPIPSTEWLDEVVMFDQTNPEVQDYLIDVATYWMDELDIDGYKIHAADQANPAFLEKLALEVKKKQNSFYLFATSLQGDSLENICHIEHIDGFANEELYAVMNEVFAKPDQPVSQIYETWEKSNCDRNVLFVDNKNVARFSYHFAEEGRNALTTWTLALTYLMLAPGTPLFFQGSEVPMFEPGFPENQRFVDILSADPDLKKVYEKLAAARKEFAAFTEGDFEQVYAEDGFSLFKRSYDKGTVYFAINNASESHTASLTGISEDMQLRGLLHDETIRMNDDGEFVLVVDRESTEIFIIMPNSGINWGFISVIGGIMLIFIVAIFLLSYKQKKRERQA